MPTCRDIFFNLIDPASLTGIEFGPLANPTVRKEEGEVYYVDYTDTDGLRKAWHTTPPQDIEEVDFVWSVGTPLLPRIGKHLDYVVANHVVEHIPNLLGWFQEIHAVLKPGGRVCLTIPDKRFTFDARRPVSMLGEVLENNLNRLTRPPLRAIIDQVAFAETLEKTSLWRNGPQPLEPLTVNPPALEHARSYITRWQAGNDYIDANVWVFTPLSFLDIIDALTCLKLMQFRIIYFLGTLENEFDFHVHLEAVREANDPRIAESIASAKATVCSLRDEKVYLSRGTRPKAED